MATLASHAAVPRSIPPAGERSTPMGREGLTASRRPTGDRV